MPAGARASGLSRAARRVRRQGIRSPELLGNPVSVDVGIAPKVRGTGRPIGFRAPDGHGLFERLLIDVAQNGTGSSTRNLSFAGVLSLGSM